VLLELLGTVLGYGLQYRHNHQYHAVPWRVIMYMSRKPNHSLFCSHITSDKLARNTKNRGTEIKVSNRLYLYANFCDLEAEKILQ